MNPITPSGLHEAPGARFTEVNGVRAANDYGDWRAEHAALWQSAGMLDLTFRSRLCLVGADRARFLHGQVTNDVKKLRVGEGCYAAITTAKGKMQGDMNIFCLAEELLLDIEPGLTEIISRRLENYIVADDAHVVDAAPHYGLLSVQGPQAESVVRALGLFAVPPGKPFASALVNDPALGDVYLMNHARLGGTGFDLFVPQHSMGPMADSLAAACHRAGGRLCGWQALEAARIEAGIPRFGADMDESTIPLECGIEGRAITYTKGCYIGQEVINRIHSVGHVNRELRGLRLADDLKVLPERGGKLFHAGKETGRITSVVASPRLNANLALGFVRREANQIGTELTVKSGAGESSATIVELPFTGPTVR